ncbi:MAG: diacylglycerol kinase family lipid kinase [Candidatus Atribacteria bacterium]|nr:diacylglycerol kinase family lipid kinase [Candidatus Atribacteria bacterium]
MPEAELRRVKVIVNPHANHGRGREVIPLIEDGLSSWVKTDISVTDHPRQAYDLVSKLEGYDALIAAGGDGTVYEIVNGLAHNNLLDIPIGLIPTGSGNDLSKAIGVPRDAGSAMARLRTGGRKRIDLGLVNGRYYANSLAIGFDARVAHLANEIKEETRKTGLSLYMTALFRIVLHDYYGHEVRLRVDGGEWETRKVLLAAINNGPIYGGGFKITPGADNADGLLEVCVIDALPRWELFLRLPFAVAGRHTWMKKAHFYRAKTIEIESERGLPAALDGELIHDNNYRAEIVPSALTVIGV